MKSRRRSARLIHNARRWFSGLLSAQSPQSRRIVVEMLEDRQLMAGDSWNSVLLGSSYQSQPSLQAEGEAANDLVAFAKAIAGTGAKLYGAAWNADTTSQRALFEDGGKFLPFVEVTNADQTPNATATSKNITVYPTWEFPDNSRLTGVQTLQALATKLGIAIPQSSKPSFDTIPTTNVPIGSPMHVPVDAYDPNGNPLTITVTSSNPSLITAEVLQNNQSVRMNVQGYGDMVYELFDQDAPRVTERFKQLINSGFYNKTTSNEIIFHRVINNFVIQAGDPTGTGSGGSGLGNFDDQFNVNLQHNRTGILSYAKAGDDTNDSQFFITEGPQRNLDFNHSIFGQIIEGDSVRDAISNVNTGTNDKPVNKVVINSMSVFTDNENGLIRLKAAGNTTGSATITVTVTDSEGNSTQQTFTANVVADTSNGAPFLNSIASPVTTTRNNPVVVQLTSQDVEGDAVFYDASKVGTVNYTLSTNNQTGAVTITPPQDFVGTFSVLVGVRAATSANTVDTFDTQTIAVTVLPPAPTALDLTDASDSGSSNTDNITNAGSMTFNVTGTLAGATVELRRGDTVIGSATATGAITSITTTNITALGAGTYNIVATQTVSGQRSASSPALQLTYDNTAPVALTTGSVPSGANVGSALSVNLSHPEEGNGLIYALTNPPSGMTINSSTGVLSWTPSSTQLGNQTFAIQLTDAAGNTRSDNFTIAVADEAQVAYTLKAVDTNGQALTSVTVGQTFKLQFIVKDIRPNASGVFSAYTDLLYDSNLIELVGTTPISYITPYTNQTKGGITTPGLIDELGAFSTNLGASGGVERVLAEISVRAKTTGNALFRTDPADVAGNDVGVFGQDTAVNKALITFGSTTVPIAAAFQLANDTFNFNEDSSNNNLTVLANDTAPAGTTLTVTAVGATSKGGTVTIASDGKSVRYTPALNFNGSETFTYTVRDQNNSESTATVTVQVAAVNDPPVALNDTATVTAGTSNNVINVLANDNSGPDTGETLRVSAVGTAANGTLTLGTNGSNVLYTPRAGFTGTDTFSYTLSDGNGGTTTATATITVVAANPPPTAVNDTATMAEDGAAITIDAIANDSTSDQGETISISSVGKPSQGGTATLVAGKISYQPAPNFNGVELITYTLLDSRGATSQGTVTVTVTGVNDAPDAVDDAQQVLTGTTARTITVLANDRNVDTGETLTITAVTQPPTGQGTVAIASDGKSILYTAPSNSFTGNVSFTYTISDGNTLSDTASVTLNVVNFTPRTIGGEVVQLQLSSTTPISGFPVTLVGQDDFGATVNRVVPVSLQGKYEVPALAPGNYTIQRPALPFLNDQPTSIAVRSNTSDGNSLNNNLSVGALKPQFFDIRDFLGSMVGKSLTVAVTSGGSQKWVHASSNWGTVNNLQVQLTGNGTQLQIQGTNTQNQTVQTTLPITDNRVMQRGSEGGNLLLTIRGGATDLPFQTVTTTQPSGEGELSGEGEGTSNNSAIASGSSDAGAAISGSLAPVVSNGSGSTESSNSSDSTARVRLRISDFVASQHQNNFPSSNALNAQAVDAAMQQLSPSLRLSSALEDDLVSGLTADEVAHAADLLHN